MNAFMNVNTVAVTDFEMKSPTLAKVIISFTGKHNKETIRAALLEKFDNQAAPVENSFRVVRAGVAVGFLRANKEVRVVDTKELRAAYRVMSSNIMMDNKDKSLWEVRDGASGKYLARHGNEDLSELIEAGTKHRQDIPGVRHLSMAKAAKHEVVAFVSPSGDMDYGFAIASRSDDPSRNLKAAVRVVSSSTRTAMTVDYDMVTFMGQCPVPKSVNRKLIAAGISREDKSQEITYYKELFAYSPEYVKDFIRMIEQDTAA